MPKDNLKNETESAEDVENPELENDFVEKPKEVGGRVSEKIGEEIEDLKDGSQEMDNTLSGDNSQEASKLKGENEEIVDEAVSSGDETKKDADRVLSENEPTAFEVLDGVKEKLEELDSRRITVVGGLEKYRDVKINETNAGDVQKSVDDFGELKNGIREEAKKLNSFQKSNTGKMDEETVGKYNALTIYHGEISNKIIYAPTMDLYDELRRELDIYGEQEQKPAVGVSEPVEPAPVETGINADTEQQPSKPTEQDPKTKSDEEIESWKDKKEGKEDDINKYKEELGNDSEIARLLAEEGSIEDQIEELRDKTEKFAMEMAGAGMKVREQLKSVDMSEIGESEQGEARELISGLAENARNNLNVEQLKWLSEFEKEDFGDLMDTHKNKELTIEELKTMADDLKELDDYLKKFETMAEDKKKEARDEIITFTEKMDKLYKEHPEIFYVLAVAGMLVGLKLLLIAAGIGAAAWPVWLTGEVIAENAFAGAMSVATVRFLLVNKKGIGKVAKGAPLGMFGAGVLGAGWLFDKEKWDKFMEGVSKASYPGWYNFMRVALFGDEKTSKA